SDTSRKSTGPRVVLACVPCRERHVRCGAEQPECRRCVTSGKPCRYAKSRRGGLDRAALEARRRRLEAESAKESTSSSPSVAASDQPRDGRVVTGHRQDRSEEPDWLGMFVETPRSQQSQLDRINTSPFGVIASDHSPNADYCPDGKSVFPDPNLDNYYLQFHRFHPCVVPKSVLERLVRDPALLERLRPLISVMKYIGSLFNTCSRSKQNGAVPQPVVPERPAPCPFMVQCHLLYSVALYWTDDKPRAYEQLHASIDMAAALGMHDRAFATEHSAGDAVLAESFRRTWWQLLSVEASTSATDRSFVFRVCEIETTVDLPCEEDEYQSGAIPTPRTWDEYCARELETDGPGYSSFAHLVGAYRSITSALKNIPPLTKPHGSALIMQEIDTVIDGWLHLLPESKREVMSESGEIDELMFQAHMLVHTATLTAHRPFSKLLFHPLETMSSCTTYPSDEHIAKESLIVHTTRCLRAIEAQVRLLALPAERFSHTPFIVCMVTTGAIPLLSACRTLFKGKELAVGRNQLRLIIGCLKALAETWPRAAKYVREIQELARILLAVSSTSSTPSSVPPSAEQGTTTGGGVLMSSQEGQQPPSQGTLASPDGVMSDANNEWLSADILAAISSMPTIGAGWNLNDFPPGVYPWWPSC
ncbi:C6 transcription factor, partial [Apiospora arundinis]